MRKILFAILVMISVPMFSQMGPGPVVSVSDNYLSLPDQVKSFISRNFPGVGVASVEHETLRGKYEVELVNGFELDFLTTGQWVKVDAPDGENIPISVVKNLLPANAYNWMQDKKFINRIEEISYNPNKGFKLESHHDKKHYFDLSGNRIGKKYKW